MTIKGIFTFALSAALALSTEAQEGPKGYNYNQNYQVKEFIKDGDQFNFCRFDTYKLSWPTLKCAGDYTVKKIDMGYTDVEGNPVYRLMFTKPKKMLSNADTVHFIPDNYFYPTHYQAYNLKDGAYKMLGKFLIDGGKTIVGVRAGATSASTGNIYYSKRAYVGMKDKGYYVMEGSGKGVFKDHKAVREELNLIEGYAGNYGSLEVNVPEFSGIGVYTNNRNKYFDAMTAKAKSKSAAELYNELTDHEYQYIEKGNWPQLPNGTKFKIKIKRDSNGKVESVMLHKAFTDGKYYDKEKFYIPTTQMSNGLFKIIDGDLKNRLLVPFKDFLLLVRIENGTKAWIDAVLSNEVAKQGFEGDYNSSHTWGDHLASHEYGDFGTVTSENYWCKQELEEEYNWEKDDYFFVTWFNRYYKAIHK